MLGMVLADIHIDLQRMHEQTCAMDFRIDSGILRCRMAHEIVSQQQVRDLGDIAARHQLFRERLLIAKAVAMHEFDHSGVWDEVKAQAAAAVAIDTCPRR